MAISFIKQCTVATVLSCLMSTGCEAIVGDYDVKGCRPEIPEICDDIGGEEEQRVGCCSEDALTIYYCDNSGNVISTNCGNSGKVCDYDAEKEFMVCVEN